jgi:hypothetical protein
MLANGPQCIITGWPSSVWTRFGFEEHGHRACGSKVLRGDRLAFPERIRGGDVAQATAQVLEVAGHRHDRHHLGGRGDVEAALARIAVGASPEPDGDLPQRPVVHVHGASPGNPQRIDVVRVAVQDRGVDHRGEQVVGGADRMDVAREVEVEVLHRHNLGKAAARRATLDPEHRADRRLAQAGHRVLADHPEALGQADQRGGLTLAGAGRRHAGDADDLRVLDVL